MITDTLTVDTISVALVPDELKARLREVKEFCESLKGIKITTPDQSLRAANMKGRLDELDKIVEKDYQTVIQPYLKDAEQIRAVYFPTQDAIKEGKKTLRLEDYNYQQACEAKRIEEQRQKDAEAEAERKRKEEEAKALQEQADALANAGKVEEALAVAKQAEAQEIQATTLTPVTVVSQAPHHRGGAMSVKKKWFLEVTDEEAFLAQCIATPSLHRLLMINPKAGNNLATELKKPKQFNGAEVKEKLI